MADCPANSAKLKAAPVAANRLRVLLPLPLPAALDYRAAQGEAAPEPGRFVRVDLGTRRLIGVVWGDGDAEVADERLRPVGDVLPTPPLPEALRRFVDRVASYTLSPPGMVLRMAMSVEAALIPPAPRRVCAITVDGVAALAGPPSKNLTTARRRVLEGLNDMPAETAAETARRAGVGAAVVRGLVAAGFIVEQLVPPAPPRVQTPDWREAGSVLVAGPIARRRPAGRAGREQRVSKVTVLDGVTGSGKTETYFAAIAAALAKGKQVLVLLPEDRAVGAMALDRFRRRARRAAGRSGIRISARRNGAIPGARSPTVARASWSARAPRCVRVPLPELEETRHRRRRARSVIQAVKTASAIRRATWRCCALRWRRSRSCWRRLGDAVSRNRGQHLARTLRPASTCRSGTPRRACHRWR